MVKKPRRRRNWKNWSCRHCSCHAIDAIDYARYTHRSDRVWCSGRTVALDATGSDDRGACTTPPSRSSASRELPGPGNRDYAPLGALSMLHTLRVNWPSSASEGVWVPCRVSGTHATFAVAHSSGPWRSGVYHVYGSLPAVASRGAGSGRLSRAQLGNPRVAASTKAARASCKRIYRTSTGSLCRLCRRSRSYISPKTRAPSSISRTSYC